MTWEEMIEKMAWLGHDAFRIEASKTVYFDPFGIAGGPKADLILISHDHFDHCSPEDVAKVQGKGTVIVTEKNSATKLSGDIRIIKPGDVLDVEGVKVTGVPSYNTDKDFHPRRNSWLGFIVELDGVRIYHAGDTDFIPEMKNFRADIALIPVSGTYVMNADQAVKAALSINPKLAIPMHYGAIVGDEKDALRFKEKLEGKVAVRIFEKS
ncbi:MAG: MBL fold metallo-hydrolase [Deltaproteobacteria bacterium]|nr:MBL fold metallo-hydrolase [Deltaproteobacteria bacterium]